MKIIDISNMSVERFRHLFLLNKNYIEKAFVVNNDILVTLDKETSMYPNKLVSSYDFRNYFIVEGDDAYISPGRNGHIPYITSIGYDCDKEIICHIEELYYKYLLKRKRREYTEKINLIKSRRKLKNRR